MDEATALLTTLTSTDPSAPTACTGWTAHHIVAHLAAGAAEMASHIEEALSGRGERATAHFADREAPFVAMDDEALRGRLLTEALRLNAATQELLESGTTVLFSGRRMSAADIETHGRSEAALHRWDLCGDDDVGDELLEQPDLTEHAVHVLNAMIPGSGESPAIRAEAAGLSQSGRFEFGSPGQYDVVLVINETGASFELASPVESPLATSDPTTRLLALWGRRSPNRAIKWQGPEVAVDRFRRFLWGA
jgi:uncharacterized protein (TIGR03083 family)